MLRLRYFFLYNSAEKSGLPGHDCSAVSLLPPWHSATPHRWLIMLLLKSPNSGIPQNRSSSWSFIRFGLLRASPKMVGAALGPSGLSINVFPICRSTPWPSFENPAWISSDSNTISYTHIPGAPPFRLTQTDVFFSFFCTTSP